jgi:hypothetical protein
MNKRFKGARFDKRIIRYGKRIIYPGDNFFQVNVGSVGEDADAVVQGRNHEYSCAKTAIKTGMIY